MGGGGRIKIGELKHARATEMMKRAEGFSDDEWKGEHGAENTIYEREMFGCKFSTTKGERELTQQGEGGTQRKPEFMLLGERGRKEE